MPKMPIRPADRSVLVDVLVVPNASRTEIVGVHGDRIKVRVSQAPEKGRANRAVEKLIMRVTGATRAVVVSGDSSRRKTVELWGVSESAARSRLGAHP